MTVLIPYLNNFTMGLLVNHVVTRQLRYRDMFETRIGWLGFIPHF